MNGGTAARLLFYAGFALCIIQIWLPGYYITGDGPCHLYNAQILHDMWMGKDKAFYSRFYMALFEPNPNWMTTVLTALFLFVASGPVAEKMLLTIYVVLFITGLCQLLKIVGSGGFWQLAVFGLVFHHVLTKGFYNFSLSIGLMFWLVVIWLRYLEGRGAKHVVLFLLLSLFTFFAHPLAFVMGGLMCGALCISYGVANRAVKRMLVNIATLIACCLPGILLLLWFAGKEGAGATLHFDKHRLLDLLHLDCLVNISSREVFLVCSMAVVMLVLFAISVLSRIRMRGVNKYDGFALVLFIVAVLYLFFPDHLFGGSLFVVRMQLLLAIFCVMCIGYMMPDGKMKKVGALILFGCFVAVSCVRIAVRQTASEAVGDCLSASQFIKPNSVLLPLDFSPGGKDAEGKLIGDYNWLFPHVSEYLGAEKPLIILDNYEANTGYFPILWQYNVNPYLHLCTNGTIESQPPYASIQGYKHQSGVDIDYILMWCYDPAWLGNGQFKVFFNEINGGYHRTYTSASGRTILWARN